MLEQIYLLLIGILIVLGFISLIVNLVLIIKFNMECRRLKKDIDAVEKEINLNNKKNKKGKK